MQFLVKNKSLKGLWCLWMLLGLVLMGGAIACRAPETEAQEVDVAENNSNCSETVLTGRVVRKPWTKTAESWMAGGGDYYVLDVGDGEVEERSAEEGVILRESDRVTFEGFEEYIDRLVKVRGEYVEARVYVPRNPMESYPTDLEGRPLPRGAGFKVCDIEIVSYIN